MQLFIFSDESGVFDKNHEKYYIYGGLIFLGKDEKENANRKYLGAERNIARAYPKGKELKASYVLNKHKTKLYNATKHYYKFGAIVTQADVNSNIWTSKYSKQRYLDYVYKMALKNALVEMCGKGIINPDEITELIIYVDEHNTATDGKYELREGLLKEFKHGTFNYTWNIFFPPVFPKIKDIKLTFRNSSNTPLIRASDIIANRLYHMVYNDSITVDDKFYIKKLP